MDINRQGDLAPAEAANWSCASGLVRIYRGHSPGHAWSWPACLGSMDNLMVHVTLPFHLATEVHHSRPFAMGPRSPLSMIFFCGNGTWYYCNLRGPPSCSRSRPLQILCLSSASTLLIMAVLRPAYQAWLGHNHDRNHTPPSLKQKSWPQAFSCGVCFAYPSLCFHAMVCNVLLGSCLAESCIATPHMRLAQTPEICTKAYTDASSACAQFASACADTVLHAALEPSKCHASYHLQSSTFARQTQPPQIDRR